jgi:molecular chaperone DnaK (HSP70)
VLIFDLGGGTFDVSLLSIYNGSFEVRATSGDTHLGGEDFTNKILSYCVSEIAKKTGKDISEDPRALTKLRKLCDDAKIMLSESTKANIDCYGLAMDVKSILRFPEPGSTIFAQKYFRSAWLLLSLSSKTPRSLKTRFKKSS